MFLGLGHRGKRNTTWKSTSFISTCMEIERKLMNMEYGGAAFTTPPNTTTCGNFSTTTTTTTDHAAAMEMDFMDELLFEGCWLETTGALVNDPSPYYLPTLDSNINVHHQQIYQEDPTVGTAFPDQSESIIVDGTELGRRWWIGPRANPGPSSSVKDRLMLAVGYLRECTKNMNVLHQLWVPVRRGGSRYFLTATQDQPYYRNVCRAYQLAVEEANMEESGGLPGRVFMGKLPDQWTPPDVRFFKREEYPRMNYSQQYDVRGSLALPVFERGTGTCLGVVEIVTATQKIKHRPELEHVCQALEAVDLRSSQYFSPPGVKASHEELYQLALAEIIEVLASVCKTHRLPLALTWAPCYQQGKGGCRQYSDENYAQCVSTVDTACFVADVDIFGFHEVCSEYHLFRGQGTVGTAFTTAKPCFASDITAFSKTEYPLSHHASMFGLRAAVAIPLRSIYTGSADFVLEFFLPKDCQDTKEQKQMLNSLSIVLQQACRSLHAVIDKEEEEIIYPVNKEVLLPSGHVRINKEESQKSGSSLQKDQDQSSWVAHMMEAQQKGKGVSVSLEYQEEEANEEVKVTTHWDNINTQGGSRKGEAFSDFGQLQQSSGSKGSVEGGGDSYSYGSRSSGGRKSGEKRRTKTEKTISLPVLRQYFAGSLKDAAKSIGVCPTTLKRICRQHGITRWPSRKIKKAGHSLRKLQLVIDSVQGAEGAIQIGSFYSNFPELSSPGTSSFSSLKMSENSKQSNAIPESSGLFTPSKSPPSSCSQTSGPSIFCATAANQQHTTTINALSSADTLMRENPGGILQMACSEADLHALHQQEPNLLLQNSTCSLDTLPVLPESSSHNSRDGGAFKVKATFGDEKIRFSLHPNWTLGDLQMEIGRRFNLADISRVDLKYLDDDREWVLLTCDADFQECTEIYRASQSHTIRLCLQHASNPSLGSPFGSNGLS